MPIPNKRSEFKSILLHQVADRPQNAFEEVIKDTAHARDGGICFIQGVSVMTHQYRARMACAAHIGSLGEVGL